MKKQLMTLLLSIFSLQGFADGGLPSTEYQVKIGDTFESLAKRFLGDSNRAKDIKAVNRFDAENGLKIGSTIYIPDGKVKPANHKPFTTGWKAKTPNRTTLLDPSTTTPTFYLVLGHEDGQSQVFKNGEFFAVNAPVKD